MTYKSINIHGKDYFPVNERVKMAHDSKKLLSITTEVLANNPVIVKATVITSQGTFTGISAANPSKSIEKQSPYEVAETSAVGRALGFAGFGIDGSIASADEMKKAGAGKRSSIIHPSKDKIQFPNSDPLKDNEDLL